MFPVSNRSPCVEIRSSPGGQMHTPTMTCKRKTFLCPNWRCALKQADGKDLSKCPDKPVPQWLLCVCASKEWGLRKSLPSPFGGPTAWRSAKHQRWENGVEHWGGKQRTDVTELSSRRADFKELRFYSQRQRCPPPHAPPPITLPIISWTWTTLTLL